MYLKCDKDKTKVRDKYMICNMSETHCQVRKFTRSQFHSKMYDIRISECSPVLDNKSVSNIPEPIRGLEPGEDVYGGCDLPLSLPQGPEVSLPSDNTPPLPLDIVTPPTDDNTPEPEDNGYGSNDMLCLPQPSDTLPTCKSLPDSIVEGNRRSMRQRKPPAWQSSGDYEL